MPVHTVVIPKFAMTAIGVVLSILMSGNIFFVKRLVDQLDATREIVWQLRQDVTVLKLTVENLPSHPRYTREK